MPRYLVIEKRALYNGILIDAESEEDATHYNGTIVAESETDTWGDELVSCEEVDADTEDVVLP